MNAYILFYSKCENKDFIPFCNSLVKLNRQNRKTNTHTDHGRELIFLCVGNFMFCH